MDFPFERVAHLHLPNEAKELVRQILRKLKVLPNGPWKMDAPEFLYQLIQSAAHIDLDGIVPSVLMAQALAESGWAGRPYRTLFGIKAWKSDIEGGQAECFLTREEVNDEQLAWWKRTGRFERVIRQMPNGKHMIYVKDWFYAGKTVEDHVLRYKDIIKRRAARMDVNLRHFTFWPDGSHRRPFEYLWEDYVDFLQAPPGYATASDYKELIRKMIQHNALWVMDYEH